MPDSTIGNLPAASALGTSDLVPVVQGGVTKKATYQQVQQGVLVNSAADVAPGVADGQFLQWNAAQGKFLPVTVSVPVGANPTASVGLTAIPGVASTFMRSDGAPALSQAIVPTWTGLHTWTPPSNANAIILKGATHLAPQAALFQMQDSGSAVVLSMDYGSGAGGFDSNLYLNRSDGNTTESVQIHVDSSQSFININGAFGALSLTSSNGTMSIVGRFGGFDLGSATATILPTSADAVTSFGGAANRWKDIYGTWLHCTAGRSRNTADVSNATAVMANLSDLTVTLVAGRKYTGRMVVKCVNSAAAEGIQFDFNGGAATMTNFWAGAGILASGGTDVVGTNISTSLAGAITFTTFTGESIVLIEISMVCNVGGTFIPRFAEAAAHVSGTATVRLGSWLWLEDSPN